MTCIIGLVVKQKVYIGADTLATDGDSAFPMMQSKVFQRDKFLFGTAGTMRTGQIIQYCLKIPPFTNECSVPEYLITEFVPALRDCLKENGFSKVEDGQEKGTDDVMVGLLGRVFVMDSNFSVYEARDNYVVIGSGQDIAHGALFSTEHLEPEKRILNALAAATHHNTGVRGPYTVLAE